eukprot:scaffold1895_cov77-Skeletonema_marinoi.AAC.3
MTVPTEPTTTTGQANIAKVQLRMPNGKRLVRKFNGDLPVKVIYAFCAQLDDSNIREDAKAGRAFELKAKFPPVDLMPFVEDSISSFGLSVSRPNIDLLPINSTREVVRKRAARSKPTSNFRTFRKRERVDDTTTTTVITIGIVFSSTIQNTARPPCGRPRKTHLH